MVGAVWWRAGLLVSLWGPLSVAGGAGTFWVDAKQEAVQEERSLMAEVARKAMPAVVSITTRELAVPGLRAAVEEEEAQQGLGSGFIIHPDGYILTSAHVIEGTSEIRIAVLRDGVRPDEFLARVVGVDSETDCALLKIEAGRKLPVLTLGHSRSVDVADWVVVIGNPFGLGHSVTVGVVSYKGRTDVTPAGRSGYFDYLQTDASINPGNSGGPMLDVDGVVVGIANAVNVAGQGIGFGIPIEMAKEVLPQLRAHGRVRRGWMGISVQDLTPELASEIGLPSYSGVLVAEIQAGSPGEKAGLQVGDIITRLDSREIDRSHALRWKVATSQIGKPLPMEVRRGDDSLAVSVELLELPSIEGEPQEIVGRRPGFSKLGVAVVDVDARASLSAGLAHPFGALVQEVEGGSAAAKAGLQRGDVILKLNDREVTTREDFLAALEEIEPGGTLRLFLRRAGRTVALSLEKP